MNPYLAYAQRFGHGRPTTGVTQIPERVQRCPLCEQGGADRPVKGNDRWIHAACADELGIPTALLVPEVVANE